MTLRRKCRYPTCNNAISPRNVSGVCRDHLHEAGYCGCEQCWDKYHKAQAEAKPKLPRNTVVDFDAMSLEDLCKPVSGTIISSRTKANSDGW